MKVKGDVYAVGVIGFTALVLLLVVAVFIGPRSDATKQYADSLDKLAASIESRNDQLRDKATGWDCQTALKELDTHYITGRSNTWAWQLGVHSVFVLEVGDNWLPLLESVDVDQSWSKVAQLQDERWQIINQKLAGCVDNQGGSDDNSRD